MLEDMKGKFLIAAAALLMASCTPAFAGGSDKTIALSTNLPTWGSLLTMNCEVQMPVSPRWSCYANLRYNPFTYSKGSWAQTQLRQLTPEIGARWWLDGVYDGFFFEGFLLASEYSVSYPPREHYFDGFLWGAGAGFGCCFPVAERIYMNVGAGIAAARHNSTYYMGPVCGQISGHKRDWVVFPSDLIVSLMIMLKK